jgi:hypothetical protein
MVKGIFKPLPENVFNLKMKSNLSGQFVMVFPVKIAFLKLIACLKF